MFKLELSN